MSLCQGRIQHISKRVLDPALKSGSRKFWCGTPTHFPTSSLTFPHTTTLPYTYPHIFLRPSPFLTPQHTSPHTFPYISLYSPHTPTHFPPTPVHLSHISPNASPLTFSKCDAVSVAKLPCGEVSGKRISAF